MKYLNDEDLCFSATLFGNPPADDSVKYTIRIFDRKDNLLKEYFGSFFFYDRDQMLYYDFLLHNIDIPLSTDSSHVSYCEYLGFARIYDAADTFLSEQEIVFAERYYMPGSALNDDTYNPTNGVRFPLPGNVTPPKLAYGETYPFAVTWSEDYSRGDETLSYRGDHVYPVDAPGFYNIYHDIHENETIDVNGIDASNFVFKHVCDAPYMLLWYDTQGYWQSQPFYGTHNGRYEHGEVTNLRTETFKYQTVVEDRWDLYSAYSTRPVTYKNMFVSKYIYLYNTATYEYTKVLVTDTDYHEYKGRRAYRFNITLVKDTKYTSR